MNLSIALEPAAQEPTFDLNLTLRELPLTSLNDFLRAYLNIDAESGMSELDIEIAAAKNRFQGYLKLIAHNVSIFRSAHDTDSTLEAVWETLAGIFAEIFENQRHDQIAARAPLSGSFEDPEVGLWSTILSVLQNAFIEAQKSGTEDSIELKEMR